MKKFKSLLSLMLVMIFMLSLAGPMAFADDAGKTVETAIPVTVVVNAPRFNEAENKYVFNGYTVIKSDGTAYDSADFIDGQLQASVSGNTPSEAQASVVMSTKSGETVVKAANDHYYSVTFDHRAASLTKTQITITPDEVYFDGGYKGRSATVSGSYVGSLAYTFNTSSSGSSVTITPVGAKITDNNVDVTNMYYIVCAPMDMTVPTYTVTLQNPQYNFSDGKYEITGAADYTAATIHINDHSSAYKVKPEFNLADVEIDPSVNPVKSHLDASKVTLKANGVDVTGAFNLDVVDGSYTKTPIVITPFAPVNGESNDYRVTNPDGSDFDRSVYNVEGYVYVVDGVAQMVPGSVKVTLDGVECTDLFDITLRTASSAPADGSGSGDNTGSDDNTGGTTGGNNGGTTGGNTGNGGNTTTTPNTSLVVYTGSKSWVYDGASHYYHGGDSYTGLPTGWKVSVNYADGAKITNVGTVVNKADVTVYDENGNVVPETSYKVVYGDLTVTKRALTIQATSAGKTPNGYAFSEKDAKGVKFVNDTSLVSGHSLASGGLKVQYQLGTTTYTDYKDVTKAGTYIKRLILVDNVAVVVDAAGNDMTNNYAISTIDGTLTINSGWVSPDTGDYSNIGLWITLLAISAVAVAAVVVVVLKKSKKA